LQIYHSTHSTLDIRHTLCYTKSMKQISLKFSKIILDLCGGTGSWSSPYAEAGYDVRNITLPEHDVRLYKPPRGVHGIFAAPPCTLFAVSGARWWKGRSERELLDAISVLDACMRIILVCDPAWWCLENPRGRIRHYIGKPALIFQPWEYGDPWKKETHLWGKFNIPEKSPVEPEYVYTDRIGPQRDRADLRSITPPGFARAFFMANP
jgi:hypothetical protein